MHNCGVSILGADTKGRLESCDIAGNQFNGVEIKDDANPLIRKCK